MRVTYHWEAEQDVAEAVTYYRRRSKQSAVNFQESLRSAVGQILRAPDRFNEVRAGIQRCPLPRFPYDIHFSQLGETIKILAVKHHSQHPEYGSERG